MRRTALPVNQPLARRDLWIALGLGVAVLAYLLPLRSYGLSVNDDGFWLQAVLRMRGGEILYRDLWTFYGPGIHHALVWLFALTEPSLLAARTFFAVCIVTSVVCTFLVARRFAPRSIAWLPATIYGLVPGPWHKAYFGTCTAVFFLLLARAIERPGARGFAWAGMMAGISLVTRQDLGLAQILLLLGCAFAPGVLPARGERRDIVGSLSHAAAALAAFGVPVLATAAYYQSQGALDALVDATFVRAFAQSGAHPNPFSRLLAPATFGLAVEGRAVGMLMLLPLVIYPLFAWRVLARWWRTGPTERVLLGAGLLAYAVATLGQAYYPMLLLRFLQSAIPFYLVATWLLAEAAAALHARGRRGIARALAIAVAAAGATLVWLVWFGLPEVRQPIYTGSARVLQLAHPVDVLGETVNETFALTEEIRCVRAFFAAHSAPGEPTFALPSHPLYPVLLDRPNPTRYLADHPIGDFVMSAEQKRAEAARLSASSIRFVVVDQQFYARPTPPDPLLALLRADFHPVRGYGNVLILERGNDPAWQAFAARLQRAIATGPRPADLAPWKTFAETHPDQALAWRMLGLARQASGNPGGAIEALHRAVELDPADVAPLETTAMLLARLGRRGEALDDLRRARTVRDSEAIRALAAELGAPP